MKKLLSIIILSFFWSEITYGDLIELNNCFLFKKNGKVINSNWEEYNNKGHKGYDVKYTDKDYSDRMIIYEGPKYDYNLYSINTETNIVTELQVFNEDYLRAFRKNLSEWGQNNPKLWEKLQNEDSTDINLMYRKRSFATKWNLTDFAGGIAFADYEPSFSKKFNIRYKIEIDLKKNEIFEISEPIDRAKKSLGHINKTLKCGKASSKNTIEPQISSGTAFFINLNGNLLTNNHVVEGCDLSKISYKNKDYDAKLIATDKTLDLALLKANVKPKEFFNFSNKKPKKLNKIYVAGYPLGKGLSDDLKISSGIISSLKGFEDNSNEIQIDAPINPGNSGGPIVNENGDLVAIAVSGLAKDQTEGINFGIKSSAAELFLISNNINPKKSMYAGIKDKDQLLEILEEGTVYTYCNN